MHDKRPSQKKVHTIAKTFYLYKSVNCKKKWNEKNDHCSKLKALPHTFPAELIGKVGETHLAHQLFVNDGRKDSMVQQRTWTARGATWHIIETR